MVERMECSMGVAQQSTQHHTLAPQHRVWYWVDCCLFDVFTSLNCYIPYSITNSALGGTERSYWNRPTPELQCYAYSVLDVEGHMQFREANTPILLRPTQHWFHIRPTYSITKLGLVTQRIQSVGFRHLMSRVRVPPCSYIFFPGVEMNRVRVVLGSAHIYYSFIELNWIL